MGIKNYITCSLSTHLFLLACNTSTLEIYIQKNRGKLRIYINVTCNENKKGLKELGHLSVLGPGQTSNFSRDEPNSNLGRSKLS